MTPAAENAATLLVCRVALADACKLSLEAHLAEEHAIMLTNTSDDEAKILAAHQVADELRPRAVEAIAAALALYRGEAPRGRKARAERGARA